MWVWGLIFSILVSVAFPSESVESRFSCFGSLTTVPAKHSGNRLQTIVNRLNQEQWDKNVAPIVLPNQILETGLYPLSSFTLGWERLGETFAGRVYQELFSKWAGHFAAIHPELGAYFFASVANRKTDEFDLPTRYLNVLPSVADFEAHLFEVKGLPANIQDQESLAWLNGYLRNARAFLAGDVTLFDKAAESFADSEAKPFTIFDHFADYTWSEVSDRGKVLNPIVQIENKLSHPGKIGTFPLNISHFANFPSQIPIAYSVKLNGNPLGIAVHLPEPIRQAMLRDVDLLLSQPSDATKP